MTRAPEGMERPVPTALMLEPSMSMTASARTLSLFPSKSRAARRAMRVGSGEAGAWAHDGMGRLHSRTVPMTVVKSRREGEGKEWLLGARSGNAFLADVKQAGGVRAILAHFFGSALGEAQFTQGGAQNHPPRRQGRLAALSQEGVQPPAGMYRSGSATGPRVVSA